MTSQPHLCEDISSCDTENMHLLVNIILQMCVLMIEQYPYVLMLHISKAKNVFQMKIILK